MRGRESGSRACTLFCECTFVKLTSMGLQEFCRFYDFEKAGSYGKYLTPYIKSWIVTDSCSFCFLLVKYHCTLLDEEALIILRFANTLY